MWQRFESTTPVMIQGMTGKEGQRLATWLIADGITIVGGVTPGKGGQTVLDRPIFDTVAALRTRFPQVSTSCIIVPAPHVLAAVEEALAAGCTYLHILSENVPVHDAIAIRTLAIKSGAHLLGPSSIGYLQFPRFRLGYLGGERPFTHLHEGSLAIVSTSGGMANELLQGAARANIGVRLALAVGGDRIPAFSLLEAVQWTEQQADVTRILVFVEPGNLLLKALLDGTYQPKKPFVLFLPGEFLDTLPRGVPYGHTGTLLGEADLSIHATRALLRERGIVCTTSVATSLTACKVYDT